MPPGSCGSIEEVGLLVYDLDSESFLLAAHDMGGFEFAALDALPHGLARDAERLHRLAHGQEALAGVSVEPGYDVLGCE